MRSTPVTGSWSSSPKEHSTFALDIPTRCRGLGAVALPGAGFPSLHWGNEHLWANPPNNPADPHNPMIDSKGRVWTTSKIRENEQPTWCNAELGNKFADWFPLHANGRQASSTIPKTSSGS